MESEKLKENLAQRGITLQALIYNSANVVLVYQGMCRQSVAAIKLVQLPAHSDYTVLERECQALLYLQHPSILHLYDCFWTYDHTNSAYLVIATQLCPSDLGKEITRRSKISCFWQEADLWAILANIVDALAFMQTKGVAHRDIKPENLFIDERGKVVVGDLGSAKAVSPFVSQTLIGTPLYLSPVLRKGYGRGVAQVTHDVYKSDVYSLGVTFIYMSTLMIPIYLLSPQSTPQTIADQLASTYYSDAFKQVLIWMVADQEDQRCDLIQLKAYIASLFPERIEEKTGQTVDKPGQVGGEIGRTGDNPPAYDGAGVSREQFQANLSHIECLQCKKLTKREELKDADADTAVVRLLCNPSDHLFCSKNCYHAFRESQGDNPVCPKCNNPIQLLISDKNDRGWCPLF